MPIASEKERGQGVRFSRIRRITGYLTGDLSTWGSAKKTEEKDRYKHIRAIPSGVCESCSVSG